MKRKNVCIWKVDKSLSEISTLLTKDYTMSLELLVNEDIPENDKNLLNKWTILNNSLVSNKKVSIENKSYDVITCRAQVECNSLNTSAWINDGKVVPKEIRVRKNESDVIFITIGTCTYCIVLGQKNNEGKIRSKLMESKKKSLSIWGKVQFKDILGYQFNKEFYYWLIINKGNIFKHDDKSIKLVNVRGFRSGAERQETSYSGDGDDIDKEIPLMSLISMNEKLISLYIGIKYDKLSYSFSIDYDGRISVCESECGEFTTQTPRSLPINKIVMDIYFDIIPFLLYNFNIDKNGNWDDTQYNHRKKYAIGIIAELAKENKLSLKEIEVALTGISNPDKILDFKDEINHKENEKDISTIDLIK